MLNKCSTPRCVFFIVEDGEASEFNEYNKKRWGAKKLKSNITNSEHLSKNFSELRDSIPKVTFFIVQLQFKRQVLLSEDGEERSEQQWWRGGRNGFVLTARGQGFV